MSFVGDLAFSDQRALEQDAAENPATAAPEPRFWDGGFDAVGGGLARGHPISASGAIALVRSLAQLQASGQPGALSMAAIAGAGGIGAATLVQWLGAEARAL